MTSALVAALGDVLREFSEFGRQWVACDELYIFESILKNVPSKHPNTSSKPLIIVSLRLDTFFFCELLKLTVLVGDAEFNFF